MRLFLFIFISWIETNEQKLYHYKEFLKIMKLIYLVKVWLNVSKTRIVMKLDDLFWYIDFIGKKYKNIIVHVI